MNRSWVQDVLDEIELNLDRNPSLTDLSSKVGVSHFHFQRIFQAVTGFSAGEYMRLRRLSEAAKRLIETEDAILGVAIESGFESQESFSRAFRKVFAKSPGQYRLQGRLERFVLPVLLSVPMKQGVLMKPRIVEFGGLEIVGLQGRVSVKRRHEIAELWAKFRERWSELEGIGRIPTISYCTCDGPEPDSEMTYTASLVVPEGFGEVPEGMTKISIPAGDYAVFEHHGSVATIPQTYRSIYGQWMPFSERKPTGEFDFAMMGERFRHGNPQAEDSMFEIYIPLRK